jgi:hypothetical protein
MPFNSEFVRNHHSDSRTTDLGGIGIVNDYLREKSGLFTYTFDDKDLMNLRNSIVNSLTATNHFNKVNDINITDNNLANKGIRLFIDFESMGVSEKGVFICEINAKTKICDANEKVLEEKDIHIRKKGILTLSEAKNGAIKQFILELESLLNHA